MFSRAKVREAAIIGMDRSIENIAAESLLTFSILLLIFLSMSIGVMFGRKPISGSCGGLAALGEGTDCEICGGDPAKCK